jgi:hypothetical protein
MELLEILEKKVEESHKTLLHLTEDEAIKLNDLLDKLRG